MRRDVHMHLERGTYTRDWVEQFVNKAIEEQIDEIWILEHTHRFREFLPLYDHLGQYGLRQADWVRQKGSQKLEDYLTLIQNIRKIKFPVTIRWGLEVCYFPGKERFIESEIKTLGLDFLVGAVHWIDGFGFDQNPEFWKWKNVNHEYRRYYEIISSLITSDLFDGLAHPDSIKCYGYMPSYNLQDTYYSLAEQLNEHNMYAEESSGLFTNYGYKEAGMNLKMLKIFQEMQVRLEMASDAHAPWDVGHMFQEMENYIRGL